MQQSSNDLVAMSATRSFFFTCGSAAVGVQDIAVGLDQLLDELLSSDVLRRRAASERIATGESLDVRAAIPLLDAVMDQDDQVREWITAALEGMGAPDPCDVEAIAGRLAAQSADRSYWAATLLGRLGPAATPAIQELASALNDHPSLATRERTAWALGNIGPAAKSALPALRNALQSGPARLARLAEAAIAGIGDE
jgi:HEAT repeat protein